MAARCVIILARLYRMILFCVIILVKLYQRTLSRILPDSCIFTPSCSEYAVQALSKYGLFKGVALAVWRILRCNPFNKNGGCDPVP